MFFPIHAGPELTLGAWTCSDHEPGWSAPEPVHRYEIVLPTAGSYVRELAGVELVGSPNAVLFANPGDVYRVRHPVRGGDDCVVVLLSDAAVEELAPAGARGRPRLPSGAGSIHGPLFLRMLHTVRAARAGDAEPLEVEELGAELAAAAWERREGRAGRRGAGRSQERAVARGLEFIAAGYQRRLLLADVARAAAYSPFHFARLFRRTTGLPVHRYVVRLRLREAVSAVLDGEEDLTRLALRLGFSSHSHLTAAFQREYGLPPSRLRATTPLRLPRSRC